MFDESPSMIAIHPVFYLKGNNYLMESLALIKYPSKFNEVLQQMMLRTRSALNFKNDKPKSFEFSILPQQQTQLTFLEGSFNEGTVVVPEIKKGIEDFKKSN